MSVTNGPRSQNFDKSRARLTQSPREADFFNDPYPTYQFLHAESPTFFWEDFGHWCFAAHADVTRLLRDKRFGRQILHVATREELNLPAACPRSRNFDRIDGLSMLQLEPPQHTRLRRLVNRAFVASKVESLKPNISALANRLIDGFENEAKIDLLSMYAAPIPVTVIAQLLGVPEEMTTQLLDWSHRMVAMYQFGRDEKIETDADAAALEFGDYVGSLIAEKRNQPDEGLLSQLCAAQDADDVLTDDEIVSTTILLLNAGHEATVHQTGNAIKTIIESCSLTGKSPDSLFATPESSAATIEEAMRFDPPLHMFNRYALVDLELECSQTKRTISLAKGDEVGLLLGAANHDPTVFENPEVFDPSRSKNNHVAFGGGIHFCLGAPLARLEMQITLQTLFERLPGIKLAGKPIYRDAYHFHGLQELNVSTKK